MTRSIRIASLLFLMLGQSPHRGDATLSAVEEMAVAAVGSDVGGHRTEFLDLVRRAKMLQP